MKRMLQPTKKTAGFTLIELLVATVILAGISVVSVQLLWDSVSLRSKQTSIEQSSDNFRLLINNLTKEVQGAQSISVPNAETLEIVSSPCRTIRKTADGKGIEEATSTVDPCTPPTSGFVKITQDQFAVRTLEFTPLGTILKSVTMKIAGDYKDSLGNHPVDFQTTISPRVSL